MCHGFWAPRNFYLTTISISPMQLVAEDYHWEGTNGKPSCGGSILMWTDEASWEKFYSSLDAFMRGGCQPTGEHQDVGSGQVFHWEVHSQQVMGVRVLFSHLKRAVLAERAVHSVFIKDRSRMNMNVRQIVTQDDDESKQSLGGSFVETNYIFVFQTWEERGDEQSVFFIYSCLHLSPKHLKVFTWNSVWIIMLMEFKLEIRATERMKQVFLCRGCSWSWNSRFGTWTSVRLY